MSRPKILLLGSAASCLPFIDALGLSSAAELVSIFRERMGDRFELIADEQILEAKENELRGGRNDDQRRADEITAAMADDDVVALLSVRGGAWFTRILPLIDFSVLDGRRSRIAAIGFSELTTLVNIIGAHPMGLGIYDMGPAFLSYGLRRQATSLGIENPKEWATERIFAQLNLFLDDVSSMLQGNGTSRSITASLAQGTLPKEEAIELVGGNLVVLSTLVGSRFVDCVKPTGRWLVLEEINEKPERIDRFLATLTLANFWENCRGLLLGDFHRSTQQLTNAVLELLPYHLPQDHNMPILVTQQVGHIWPMSPLPLHQKIEIARTSYDSLELSWDNRSTNIVG